MKSTDQLSLAFLLDQSALSFIRSGSRRSREGQVRSEGQSDLIVESRFESFVINKKRNCI
jgi:hypothetical protein